MTNHQFAKKLAKMSQMDKRSSNLLVEPNFPQLHKIEEMVVDDFGIDNLLLLTPLFSREVFLNKKLINLIQVKTNTTDLLFTIWGVVTEHNFYLLVGTEIEFFPDKSFRNPFKESDDLDIFAIELKSHLGIAHAVFYEGNELYNYATIEEDSKIYSFFLYKV